MFLNEDDWDNYKIDKESLNTNSTRRKYSSAVAVPAPVEEEKKEPEKVKTLNKINKNNFDIVISTKTKTLTFNTEIDIKKVFWDIDIIPYSELKEGIVRKETRIINNSYEERAAFEQSILTLSGTYYRNILIKEIDIVTAQKTKYNQIIRLICGINNNDLIKKPSLYKNNKLKENKSAFYNAIGLYYRIFYNNVYKEIHIKIFNTGIIKITGIINDDLFEIFKPIIYDIVAPLTKKYDRLNVDNYNTFLSENRKNIYSEDNINFEENVLINSTLKFGFMLDISILYQILTSSKYNLEVSYDNTNYHGLRCKYYFNNELGLDEQTGIMVDDNINKNNIKWKKEFKKNGKYKKATIMIFSTGNGLMMGSISEKLIRFIYEKIKNILIEEYDSVFVGEYEDKKIKNKKIKKKEIFI